MVSRSSNPGRHAVLALLSERYPPLRGRSPTCYSPVRHSTQGRSPFRVRLACVRHAASVDSEPGSNSHVKVFVRLSTIPAGTPRLSAIRTAPFNSTHGHLQQKAWGSFVCLSIAVGVTHQLILRRAGLSRRGALKRPGETGSFRRVMKRGKTRCARSIQFSKNQGSADSARPNLSGFPRPPDRPRETRSSSTCPAFAFVSWRPSGEPFYFTIPFSACQPFLFLPSIFVARHEVDSASTAKVRIREGRGGAPTALWQ